MITQVMARLRSSLSLEPTIRVLFEHLTLKDVFSEVENMRGRDGDIRLADGERLRNSILSKPDSEADEVFHNRTVQWGAR